MKRLRTSMALALSLALSLGNFSTVYADDTNVTEPATSTIEETTPVWAGTLDTSISISGLNEGDTVKFYQVLAYDDDAAGSVSDATDPKVGAASWKAVGSFRGMTLAEFKAILSDGITADIAGSIGKMVTGNATYTQTASSSGIATQVSPDAGLYVAIITPVAGSDTTYNPVFVGADYYTNKGNEWVVTADMSYADEAMAKKSDVTLDKTAIDSTGTVDTNDKETVAVGDVITFTINTTIPGFAENYTSPVFKISDKMSKGLTYTPGSATVELPAGLAKDDEYTVNEEKESNGQNDFVLSFASSYLKTVKTATSVKITYTATVNSDALTSVNPEDNTVTLNYSNSPSDTEGHGIKKDKTNHYSFDIDANLFGVENYEATEIVKVGVDQNGNEITETKQLSNTHWVGALENAEFKLYKDSNGVKGDIYTNKYYKENSVFVSDGNGTLKLKGADVDGIRGLDAGVYWLEETKAPTGYIKMQQPVKIEIEATVNEVDYTSIEKIDGKDVEVTYKANELVSYKVKVGGVETANYTMVNETENGEHPHISATQGDTIVGGTDSAEGKPSENKDGKLQNTQGVELPSTGGIGTTLFYVIGAILVIGAGSVLVTRRKMNVK